jgi:hypothetical protein
MRIATFIVATLFSLFTAACDRTGAFGDATSIVAAMDPGLWSQVENDVYSTLEPTIQTVRDERTFTVTFQDPTEELWGRLRQFKQLLLVGTGEEDWMADVMGRLDDVAGTPPQILQVRDVWARAQSVTVILLPESGQPDALRSQLGPLHELYDSQYRSLALSRMFISGRDSALADTLSREAGFSLLLPEVYYWDRTDSVYLFRNDNPDPSELIRQVAVTWRTPLPAELDGEELLAWRAELAGQYYAEPQVVDLANVKAGPFSHEGWSAYQIQAVWQNAPEANWPAGGPFILWALACPAQDRLYLLDSWLYAPGREKYQYMIQLETILGSFRCET